MFSERAIDLVTRYFQKLPKLFKLLEHGRSLVFESELFSESIGENSIQDIVDWINQQDHKKCEKRSSGIDTVEREAIPLIIDSVKKIKVLKNFLKYITFLKQYLVSLVKTYILGRMYLFFILKLN